MRVPVKCEKKSVYEITYQFYNRLFCRKMTIAVIKKKTLKKLHTNQVKCNLFIIWKLNALSLAASVYCQILSIGSDFKMFHTPNGHNSM